jgi:streptogrisin C
VTTPTLPRPASDIYGGLEINGSGCTSGFSVVNGSGTRGITIAGHCSTTDSYQGIDLPYVAGFYGGNYDVQWHTASAFSVQNWITDGAVPYTRPITSRTFWGNQPVGGFVCKYGRSSGYGCGTINRKDDTPTCIPGARPVWLRVGVAIMGGDSGGPVFYGESAYGTISCGDASTLIYSAVDFVESGVGVTVLTSP